MRMQVSVIIVNYNCGAYIGDCLRSLFAKTSDVSFEVIIVDNASTDNSLQQIRAGFPAVKIIENGKNIGFGAANNVGAKHAGGEYLLLLNPDTMLQNNALAAFYKFMSESMGEIGCCGGVLLDDTLQPANLGGNFPGLFQLFSDIGFRYFYPGYYKRKVSLMLTEATIPADGNIDCICGADLFIRKDVFDLVGGFDEAYFLYYEDTDLCFRLKKLGYRNHIVREARILHLESAVIAGKRNDTLDERKFTFFEKGKQFFFKKSYGAFSLAMARFLTLGYIITRCMAHRASVSTCLRLMRISLKTKTT